MKKIRLFLSLCAILSINSAHSQDTLITNVQTAINNLGPNNPFAFYDLNLSDNEIKTLEKITINSPILTAYNNYGHIDKLEVEVNEFIKKLSQENEIIAKEVSQLIEKLVKELIQASGKETAWVALRPSIPNSDFDLPRWHHDGYFYKPYDIQQYKFALVLKGPSTLFCKLSPDEKKAFDILKKKEIQKIVQDESGKIIKFEEDISNRQALATMISDFQAPITIAKPYQGAVFVVGGNKAAIHSEPPISTNRLFLSILPGSKSQIDEFRLGPEEFEASMKAKNE
ncbi:MAG: hypothetical protein Q8L85_04220 [Alphaproteobacteria bacterium]|nr:hypothetical protein [Alphaproteobacteria bacterium]